MKLLLFNIFLSCVVLEISSAKFPSTFQKCKRDDEKCFVTAIQGAFHQLNESRPELGLPNLYSLFIPSMSVGSGHGGPVSISQKFTNVKMYGFSDVIFKNSKFDFKKGTLDGIFSTNFRLEGDYELDGQVLLLPVKGKGDSIVVLEDALVDVVMNFKRITKKDELSYLNFTDVKCSIEAGHVSFQFNNLFDGDKLLGDNINKVLNENWKEVFDEIKDGYGEIFAKLIYATAHTFFSKIPEKDIFLD